MINEPLHQDGIGLHIARLQAEQLDRDGDMFISKTEQINYWIRSFAPTLAIAEERLERLIFIQEHNIEEVLYDVGMSVHFSKEDRDNAKRIGLGLTPDF
jgi:hypothetical protein